MRIRFTVFVVVLWCLPCFGQIAQEKSAEDYKKEALEAYPELQETGSALYQKFRKALEERKNTDPEYFNQADWPVRLAKECSAEIELEIIRKMILGDWETKKGTGGTPEGSQQISFGKRGEMVQKVVTVQVSEPKK